MSAMTATQTIPEFFTGKSIFVTGGTGFLGKVLLEKLLRSCGEIDVIYVLIRQKKNKTAEERLKEITDLPLYDRLKREKPGAIDKLRPIYGDIMELNLGISPEDEKILVENVSIVFHTAASVRFDDSLRDAIIMNTRGTREVIKMAAKMKKLSVLLHTSTTYCNTDRDVIDEKLYPPHADWRKSIRIAEEVDPEVLNILTAKYMGKLPNTYTFTKSMAEHVVVDQCTGKIPAVVFRPSIVISSVKEPMPGWIDNFNGPVGIFVASGKGVMRSMYTDPNIVSDYMPVDIAIKAIITATWVKGTTKDITEKTNVSFYNSSCYGVRSITMGELVDLAKQLSGDFPLNDQLWYPNGRITKCRAYHYIMVLFLHLLPAIFVDLVLKAANRKPMLIKLQRRIYIANMALEYFVTNQWTFLNEKFLDLEKKLLPDDVPYFAFEAHEFDVYTYFKNALLGAREYLLKENASTIEKAKKHSKRMWILAQTVNTVFYVFIYWLLVHKLNIIAYLINTVKYHWLTL